MCCRINTCTCREGSRYTVLLSLAPGRVLGGRVPGQGELCTAALASKEDHGAIMDLGSTTVRGFIPAKLLRGQTEGAVLWCIVTRSEAGVRTLCPAPGKVWAAQLATPTVHNMFPGCRLTATVTAVLNNGLKVEMAGGLAGYVHRDHLPDMLDPLDSYKPDTSLDCRLLYVAPGLNTVLLTLRDIRSSSLASLQPGQLLSTATVDRVEQSRLVLGLGENLTGLVSVRHMKEGKEVVKNVKKKFQVGQEVAARVLALDHCTGTAVCSLQRGLVAGTARLQDLTVGQRVSGTCKSWVDAGLLVSLPGGLTGLVPRLFLSDVKLSHPERKFLPGDAVQARVLRLDSTAGRLHLTTKPLLVREEFTVVGDWDTAQPGTVTEGVVVKVGGEGLLIQLWGDLRGWAPKSLLSREPVELLDTLFWPGMAVKCKVVESDSARDRIVLSLVLDSMVPLGRRERGRQLLKPGTAVTATVITVGETGVECGVAVEGKQVVCLLPLAHLSDHLALVPHLAAGLTAGDQLECLVWRRAEATLLTMKPSVVQGWSNSPTSYTQLSVGDSLPGVVEQVKPYGVFLRVPHLPRMVLCPTRLLQVTVQTVSKIL